MNKSEHKLRNQNIVTPRKLTENLE